MDIDAVAVFVEAAATGSLSGAARRLGISPMLASRRLVALERELGVRLLHRTTRASSPTPEGEAFLPFAETMLDSAATGRALLRSASTGAAGRLRVSTSVMFGRRIVLPLIGPLLAANPELAIDLQLSDLPSDIVGSGLDLAIRIAPLAENGLVARRLAPSPRLLVAAPAYLARRGAPTRLADLRDHDCLPLSETTQWSFLREGRETRIGVAGRFASNTIDAIYETCLAGLGLAILAEWNIAEDIAAGRLIPIRLDDAAPSALAIWAVYPTARQVLPKTRVFIAALEQRLSELGLKTAATFSG